MLYSLVKFGAFLVKSVIRKFEYTALNVHIFFYTIPQFSYRFFSSKNPELGASFSSSHLSQKSHMQCLHRSKNTVFGICVYLLRLTSVNNPKHFILDLYSNYTDCVIIHNSEAAPLEFVLTTWYLSKENSSKLEPTKYPVLANTVLTKLRLVSVNYANIYTL